MHAKLRHLSLAVIFQVGQVEKTLRLDGGGQLRRRSMIRQAPVA